MGINFGENEIESIYLGGVPISDLYLGNIPVWNNMECLDDWRYNTLANGTLVLEEYL